jgi:hypothetical protein
MEKGRKCIMKRSGPSKLLREGFILMFYTLRCYEANSDKYSRDGIADINKQKYIDLYITYTRRLYKRMLVLRL